MKERGLSGALAEDKTRSVMNDKARMLRVEYSKGFYLSI